MEQPPDGLTVDTGHTILSFLKLFSSLSLSSYRHYKDS